jgi:acyl-coenzyme A synthetase/AMP-(fatty) acid ligase
MIAPSATPPETEAPETEAPRPSLATRIAAAVRRQGGGGGPLLDDGRATAPATFHASCWVDAPPGALAGRNLLLLTRRPLNAALAMVSLDGLAARLVIAPPDLAAADLPSVIADAEIDAIVHDHPDEAWASLGLPAYTIAPEGDGKGPRLAGEESRTDWALFTSGTSGAPKMVVHSLAGLTHAMAGPPPAAQDDAIWATFYDIRRYGGLQMLLRALTGGRPIQLVSPGEPTPQVLDRFAAAGVTHVSGTPSHWRSALMHANVGGLAPRYVRLSGEIADQAVLDRLAEAFPDARIGHAYASTEAGVGFEVDDGREGFPEAYLHRAGAVEMRIAEGTLRIRSPRAARRYLGEGAPDLLDADGFVDTGDLVEARDGRLWFMGRASGVVNIGGLKVHPEAVEAVINRCPGVRASRVTGRRNPVLGAVVAAEVALVDPEQGKGEGGRILRAEILARCRAELGPFKTPATLKFVDVLPITAGGKLERRHA